MSIKHARTHTGLSKQISRNSERDGTAPTEVSGDGSVHSLPEPPSTSRFRKKVDQTFQNAESRYADTWQANPNYLYRFLEACDSGSPPEKLFLIQLYRAAGRQLVGATTIPTDKSEWFVEVAPPQEIREALKPFQTEMWLEIYAQCPVCVSGRPGSDGFTCHPDFLVEVQVNDAQCSHVNVKRTPLRIAVEVDGKRFHYDSERQIERDTERHNSFAACGLQSLRCNAWEVNETERNGRREIGAIALRHLMEMAKREVLGPGVELDSGNRVAVRRG